MPRTVRLFSLLLPVAFGIVALSGSDTARGEPPESELADETERKPPTWLGIQLRDDAGSVHGAPVSRVLDDTPASRAGLQVGDVILAVAGTEVDDLESLKSEMEPVGPGETVSLRVERDDEKRKFSVELEQRPGPRELLEERVIGDRPAGFELESLGDGDALSADALRGKPTVLEFWATWCYPCRRTAETMEKLHETHGEAIRLVGVSSESGRDLRTYRRDEQPSYAIRRDPDRAAHEAFFVTSYPTIVVLDAEGRTVEVFNGTGHRKALMRLAERLTTESGGSSNSEDD